MTPEERREAQRQTRLKRVDKKQAYDAIYYTANRQRIIDRATAWRKDRRREWAFKANTTAKRRGTPGRVDWRDLVPAPCAYCWTPCESWDHVVPLSRGGANSLENIVPCCLECNTDKRHRTPEEWLDGVRWRLPRSVRRHLRSNPDQPQSTLPDPSPHPAPDN